MERDLIVGYMAVKLTSFYAMYLYQGETPVSLLSNAACVAGFAAGAWFLWQSWRKARALKF